MTVLITTLVIYVIFIITIKVTSTRRLSALNAFDVATLALTVALIENTISSDLFIDKTWSLCSMFALAVFNHAVSKTKISAPSKRVSLISNGEIKFKELKKQGMHIDTVWSILRENDVVNLSSVRAMYIESMGNITVWKHEGGRIDPVSKLPLAEFSVDSHINRLIDTGSSHICIAYVDTKGSKDALVKKRIIESSIRFDDRIYIKSKEMIIVLNTSHEHAYRIAVKWSFDASIKELDLKLENKKRSKKY